MTNLRRLVPGLIVGAAILLPSSAAFAQDQEIIVAGKLKAPSGYEAVKQAVKVGDLNLATSAGVSAMNKRVSSAIRAMCPAPSAARPSYEKKDAKLCSETAWASAQPQMDAAVKRASAKK